METQRRSEWYNNSIIVRKILGDFNHDELLSFSLVSKTWNFEAKSSLKARGNTVAIIQDGKKWDLESEPNDCCAVRDAMEDGLVFTKLQKICLKFPSSRENYSAFRAAVQQATWDANRPELIRELCGKLRDSFGTFPAAGGANSWMGAQQLVVGDLQLSLYDFACLGELCPNVKNLCWQNRSRLALPYFFTRLKSIEIIDLIVWESEDLDWMFCGIHPEEAEELKSKDVEYLQAVHLIPVRPP